MQRVHTMNGDTFEAQRAMQNHQNYMNMMISFNRTSDEIIKNIWR